ncbi:MAG: hypothetical protein ACTSXH_01140 [Promethearchaeota archaeon]
MFGRKKEKEKKKKEEPSTAHWGAEEEDEALKAEGLKRIDMDVGRVELVDRDTSTPYIETYDEDTGELEGSILLKDENREGLLDLVKILEQVKLEQDHDANMKSIGFKGQLNVENPSKVDRLWDIDLTLKNIEQTTLKSGQIKIQELGVTEKDNVYSQDFQIKGEAKNLLLVKEYINTSSNADDILNIRDIENDLLSLKDKTGKAEAIEEIEEEEEEEGEEEEEEDETDGGAAASEYSLESFGVSIDKEQVVTFAVAMRNLFEKPISDVKVVKNILADFKSPRNVDTTIGSADVEGDQLIWTIDVLEPEVTALLKFTCDIMPTSIETIKTGTIEVNYLGSSSFSGGLAIDKFDAYTRNRFYIDIMERDEEPGVWDCKLVFDNTSEFIVQLFNADVYSTEDESKKFVDIDPNDVPTLPAGAQWHSVKWTYESDDYPTFRKLLEFRVMPDFQTIVNGSIAIEDVELSIASITGDVIYSLYETIPERTGEMLEEEEEEAIAEEEAMLIKIPTFKEKDVYASLRIENNGSAPLNEISIIHQYYDEYFQVPSSDEIKFLLNDEEVKLTPEAVTFANNALNISLKNLKDSSVGMFEPESVLEVRYPIHCIKPPRETRFESEITYLANTFPLSEQLEFRPEVPVIESVHIRKKIRLGKEILPIGDLGTYEIIITAENIGTNELRDINLFDIVPDNFEYSDFNVEPEITDEIEKDTLKWHIDLLDEGERKEFRYRIKGSGNYKPSEAQVSY